MATGYLTQPLTPKNVESEIRNAVDALVQYNMIERLGPQFCQSWRVADARDQDREFTVRMIICTIRAGVKPKVWW